jgi:predicted nucleotidyltransferase
MSVDRFVAHQREVARAAEARRRATAAAIRARLPAVVDELVRLGALRVILFGSVARGEADDDSDLDLAVSGLPADKLFEAMSIAWTVAGRPVDLVRLEEAPPTLRDRILTDGEVLRDGC